MIRCLVMSDLHNEHEHPNGPRRPTAEWFGLRNARRACPGHPDVGPFLGHLRGENLGLVVLAGDIDLDLHGITYADQVALFLGAPVVYVMGNHCAYNGRDLDKLIPDLRAAAKATCGRVTFLENERATFEFRGEKLHVLGCTLWTDYALLSKSDDDRDAAIVQGMRDAAGGLNDHLCIYLRGNRFAPAMARQLHDVSLAWLRREMTWIRVTEGPDAKVLIVTHHAPIPDANPPEYRGGKLSPAFASDLTAEIELWQPDYWLNGHTHFNHDVRIGRTRCLSSQRGYVCSEAGADTYEPLVVDL
ncbi:metallophosphoesterase [Paramagnetospirillum kuznetsovii]|nr:metallophosphoesterase [Paramagnetospirillum kuznetsovii]